MILRLTAALSGKGLGAQILRALSGSAVLRLIGMGFGFLAGVQLARGLGPSGYGVYGVVMSYVSLLAVPIEFGVPALVTREVASSVALGDWTIVRGALAWGQRTILTSFVCLVGVAVPLFALLRGRFSPELWSPTALGLLFIPMTASTNLRAAALRGLQNQVKGSLPDAVVRPALYSLLLGAAGLVSAEQMSPSLAMALQVVSVAGALLVAHGLLRRALPADIRTFSVHEKGHEWRSTALPMAMNEGMRVLQGQIVVLILGFMVPVEEVGVFRVASSTMLLMAAPLTVVNITIAPLIARLFAQGDRVRLQKLLVRSAAGMAAVTGALGLPLLVVGAPLLSWGFGAEYANAATPLRWLTLGSCLSGALGPGSILLNMTGHHREVTWVFTRSLLFLVVACPLLVWTFGINGAAVASGASVVVFAFLTSRRAKALLELDPTVMGFNVSDRSRSPR